MGDSRVAPSWALHRAEGQEQALDTSGAVLRLRPDMSSDDIVRWADLDPFTRGYIEAALRPREALYYSLSSRFAGFSDLAPETLAAILKDCEAFQAERGPGWEGVGPGHHFWRVRADDFDGFGPIAGLELARRFPHLTPYLGDDGKVYLRTSAAGHVPAEPIQDGA